MTTAPHGASCAGFPFALGVFRGLFAVCLICHFNAPARRFNCGRCPYISPALCALYALFMALWRGVAPSAVHCRFAVCCQLAAIVRRPCALGGVAGPSMLAVASGGGAPLCQSRCHSCRESCKSRWHSRSLLCKSRCESRKRGAKVAHLPQNHSRLQNPVYKGGIFPAATPPVHGKSCKSRSVSAHFTSKSLAAMYFCWSCSGVKPSSCGWFGVNTISCLSTMP